MLCLRSQMQSASRTRACWMTQQIRRLERKKALAAAPDTLRLFLDETDAHPT